MSNDCGDAGHCFRPSGCPARGTTVAASGPVSEKKDEHAAADPPGCHGAPAPVARATVIGAPWKQPTV